MFDEKDECFQKLVRDGKIGKQSELKSEKKSILSMQIEKLQQKANKQAELQEKQMVGPTKVLTENKNKGKTLELVALIVILMMVIVGYVSFKLL